jgi:hypothetical protein
LARAVRYGVGRCDARAAFLSCAPARPDAGILLPPTSQRSMLVLVKSVVRRFYVQRRYGREPRGGVGEERAPRGVMADARQLNKTGAVHALFIARADAVP